MGVSKIMKLDAPIKKIVFVEQHASLGGHMLRNVEAISAECTLRNIPHEMIAETNLKTCATVQTLLTPFRNLYQLNTVQQDKVRIKEYESLIKNTTHATLFFLEFGIIDFRVWPLILNKPHIQRHITQNQVKIIIHISNYNIPLNDFSHALQSSLQILKHHLYFSLFSEIQVPIVKEEMPEANVLYLHHPSYDAFYRNAFQDSDSEKQYLGYLGVFMERKRPDLILSGLNQVKHIPFIAHMYPFKEEHKDLFFSFEKLAKAPGIFLTTPLSQEEYQTVLSKIKLALIPYDSYEYAVKASGVLEENMLSGTPVMIPNDTWLSFFLKKHHGLGTVYEENKEQSFEKTLTRIANNALPPLQDRKNISDSVYHELSMDAFILKLNTLDNGVHSTASPLSHTMKPVAKGRSFYHTLIAENKIKTKQWKQATHHLQKALSSDRYYWKTHILCGQLPKPYTKKLDYFSTEDIIKHRLFYNPFDQKKYDTECKQILFRFHIDLSADKDTYAILHDKALLQMSQKKDPQFAFQLALHLHQEQKHTQSLMWIDMALNNLNLSVTEWNRDMLTIKCHALQFKIDPRSETLNPCETIYQKKENQTMSRFFMFSEIFKDFGHMDISRNLAKQALSKKEATHCIKWRVHQRVAELYELHHDMHANAHYQKARALLESKKSKTLEEHYNLASLFKKHKDYDLAIKEFQKVKNPKLLPHLISGIYFHLGEIYFCQKKWKLSLRYLQKCLTLNPGHIKAKEYCLKIQS